MKAWQEALYRITPEHELIPHGSLPLSGIERAQCVNLGGIAVFPSHRGGFFMEEENVQKSSQ